LGLWHDAIIDQHFSQRGRLERLIQAIETHPDLVGIGIGIGIDQDTGFVRFGDGKIRMIGAGTAASGQELSQSKIVVQPATRVDSCSKKSDRRQRVVWPPSFTGRRN